MAVTPSSPESSPVPGDPPREPLAGVRVLDFTTLLPGPLATLLLAEAGAEVIKVERPPDGDPMRGYGPFVDGTSVLFAMLNRGKRTLLADLGRAEDHARVMALAAGADVVVEQFRPGVMARLGLDYATLADRRPALVYCSITGYGQHGPRAAQAGHDLNYQAVSGLLGLCAGADGAPGVPALLAADVGAGSHPAVINILLALIHSRQTGRGCHLDIAMTDNLFALAPWLPAALAAGTRPAAGAALLSGGSPRYRIYRTADGRFLALAALEDRFWQRFCELIDLPADCRRADCAPERAAAAVAGVVATRSAAEWHERLTGEDVCCTVVEDPAALLEDPHFAARGLLAGRLRLPSGASVTDLPLPLAPDLRAHRSPRPVPELRAVAVTWTGRGNGRHG